MLVFQRVYILPLLAIETWFVWGIDMCYPAKNYPCSFLFLHSRIFASSSSPSGAPYIPMTFHLLMQSPWEMSWLFGITSQIFPVHWLVVWNIFHFPIYWEYMGTLIWLIFFRGVGQPPTRLHFPYIPIRSHEIISQSYWTWPIEIVDLPNWKMVIFQFANCKRLPVML